MQAVLTEKLVEEDKGMEKIPRGHFCFLFYPANNLVHKEVVVNLHRFLDVCVGRFYNNVVAA